MVGIVCEVLVQRENRQEVLLVDALVYAFLGNVSGEGDDQCSAGPCDQSKINDRTLTIAVTSGQPSRGCSPIHPVIIKSMGLLPVIRLTTILRQKPD